MISNDRPGFASTKMSVVSSEEPEVDQTNTKPFLLVLAGLCLGSVAVATAMINQPRMGRQPDGAFVVSTGQRIEADAKTFVGRPSDLAVHPSGKFYAVMGRNRVFLGNAERVDESAGISLGSNAGFHGLVWSPDGSTLYASTQKGHVQEFSLAADGKSLVAGKAIMIVGPEVKGNPVPGGMDISRDGKTLYVVSAERNSVIQLDLSAQPPKIVRELPVENVPYEVRITPDGKSLLVSNWGGPLPKEGDRTGKSHKQDVVVNERQSVASGTVSLIDLASGKTEHVAVGVHPTAIAFDGTKAYVANAMSDSVSELDLTTRAVARTFELRYKGQRLLGAMPNALGIAGGKLFAADGGDNAVAEIDLATGELNPELGGDAVRVGGGRGVEQVDQGRVLVAEQAAPVARGGAGVVDDRQTDGVGARGHPALGDIALFGLAEQVDIADDHVGVLGDAAQDAHQPVTEGGDGLGVEQIGGVVPRQRE